MKYLKYFENNIDDKDSSNFINYMEEFYSKPFGLHPIFTSKQIIDNINYYINKRKEFGDWGNGDSFDREIFRDYLLVKLNIKKLNEIEYYEMVKKLITPLELDQNKYNL